MHFMDDSHYDQLFNENVTITKPDGQPLMVLLKNALSKDCVGSAWLGLKSFQSQNRMRATATGISMQPYKRDDGQPSRMTSVPKGWGVSSGVIGYLEPTSPLNAYTRACSWNRENPDKFAMLFPMVKEVSQLFMKHVPDRWLVQKSFADRTPKDYLIPYSVFTTLTINKNFRTAAHKDAGDLAEGFSCLSVIRSGSYNGGYIVLPKWRVAANVDTFDLVMFDAHEFHGNTQIVPVSKDAVRCSVVYYYREGMVRSVPPSEQLEKIKNRKRGDKLL